MESIKSEWEKILDQVRANPTKDNITMLAEKAGNDYQKKREAYYLAEEKSELENKLNYECVELLKNS